MEIHTTIATEDLNMRTMIGFLADVAEGMAREAGAEPGEAIGALFSAAVLISNDNDDRVPGRRRKDLHAMLDISIRAMSVRPAANDSGPVSGD